MRKLFLLASLALSYMMANAQTTPPFVSISNIQFVSATDLANCVDSSQYEGQLVRTVGVVIVDGGMIEVASGSVQGGLRPFMYIVDTTAQGAMGPFKAIEVGGFYPNPGTGPLLPHPVATQVVAGDIVEVTGIVGNFARNTQLEPQAFNHIQLLTATAPVPQPVHVGIATLNDSTRVNQLPSGEQWEGAFVELKNVTVVNVDFFSGGSRVSFDVVDSTGGRINVSDRFIAQKLPSYTVLNPNSPYATANGGPGTGLFAAPTVGAQFKSLKGIVLHSANGCTGGTGRGFELNPFDSTHYEKGATPPTITGVERIPAVPTATQSPKVEFTAFDSDGQVTEVKVFWSANASAPAAQFDSITATLQSGSTEEWEVNIPAQANGTFVRYYIRAKDNDNNVSVMPVGAGTNTTSFYHYTVRDGGMVIPDVQFALNNGNSPYVGRQVSVKGVVTASTKDQDLGYVYIQDPNFNEWSGLWITGTGLFDLFRDEEVTATGIIEETFGFTRMIGATVTKTGKLDSSIVPVVLNPSDPNIVNRQHMERYEGMLVSFQNPNGKVHISNPNVSFGDYLIATDPANTTNATNAFFAQAGRQSNSAFSSLWCQLVTDTSFASNLGTMNVPAIATSDTMTFDAINGIVYWGFNNFRVLPRANDDLIGANFPLLPVNDRPKSTISVVEFDRTAQIKAYPNPAADFLRVEIGNDKNYTLQIFDATGRMVLEQKDLNTFAEISLANLKSGMYVIQFKGANNAAAKTQKLIINK